jgi:hypothetical protein
MFFLFVGSMAPSYANDSVDRVKGYLGGATADKLALCGAVVPILSPGTAGGGSVLAHLVTTELVLLFVGSMAPSYANDSVDRVKGYLGGATAGNA